MSKTVRIVLVGAGGIGSALVRPLCQFLCYNPLFDQVDLVIVDGDSYTESNLERQFAGAGQKAQVMADVLRSQFRRLRISAIPKYLDPDVAMETIFTGDIVLLAVDNHTSRKIVSDHCSDLTDVILISGGNSDDTGHVMVYHRANGENLTRPLASELHPEILNPTDLHPVEREAQDGCDVLARYEPQFLIVNNLVAAEMLALLQHYLMGRDMPDEVFLGLSSITKRAAFRSLRSREGRRQ